MSKFLDSMVKEFEAGGKHAAQTLRTNVVKYVKCSLPEVSHDVKVVIRVYCDIRGLSQTYVMANVLEEKENLERFVHGFSMAHPLCDFIDAGDGKECSDNKIHGKFLIPPKFLPLTHFVTDPVIRGIQVTHRRPSLQARRPRSVC